MYNFNITYYFIIQRQQAAELNQEVKNKIQKKKKKMKTGLFQKKNNTMIAK